MKKTFTLITVVLIVTASMGQSYKKNDNRFEKSENQMKSRSIIKKSIKDHKMLLLKNEILSAIKSEQEIKLQLDSLVEKEYDYELGQWVNYTKDVCGYDNNDNFSQFIYYDWFEVWYAVEKHEFVYGVNNIIHSKYYSEWDDELSDWVEDYKEEYFYNTDGSIDQIASMYLDEIVGEWVNSTKMEYTYNSEGNIVAIIEYEIEEGSPDWIESYKTDLSYDAEGNIESIIYSYWETDQWIQENKEVYIYDLNNKMTLFIASYWYFDWVNSWKSEYSYDENGNPALEIYYEWDNGNSLWELDEKYEYSYNLENYFSNIIRPSFEYLIPDNSTEIVNQPTGFTYSYFDGEDWVEQDKGTYYYSEHEIEDATATFDFANDNIKVYPNPAIEYINISFDSEYKQLNFELIDLQGKIVMNKIVNNNCNINVEYLTNGIYYYRISDHDKIIKTNKIILQ